MYIYITLYIHIRRAGDRAHRARPAVLRQRRAGLISNTVTIIIISSSSSIVNTIIIIIMIIAGLHEAAPGRGGALNDYS